MVLSQMLLITSALSHDNLKSRRTRSLASARPSLQAIASTVLGSKRPSITTAEAPRNFPTAFLATAAAATTPKLLAKNSVNIDLHQGDRWCDPPNRASMRPPLRLHELKVCHKIRNKLVRREWALIDIFMNSFPPCIPNCPQGNGHPDQFLWSQRLHHHRQPSLCILFLNLRKVLGHLLFL